MTLEEQIAAAITDGFEIVQQGRVLAPPAKGVSFQERVDGFDISALGYRVVNKHRTPETPYDNRIYDDTTRWVHLRRLTPA